MTLVPLYVASSVAAYVVQVVAALDSTYDIGMPASWFKWTAFLRFLGEINWMNMVVPSACIVGDSLRVLLLRSLVPLAVVIAMPLVGALKGYVSFTRPPSEEIGNNPAPTHPSGEGESPTPSPQQVRPRARIPDSPGTSPAPVRTGPLLSTSSDSSPTPARPGTLLPKDPNSPASNPPAVDGEGGAEGGVGGLCRLTRPTGGMRHPRNAAMLRRLRNQRGPKTRAQAAVRGAQSLLPGSLVLAFCFTPSVSAAIFGMWHCPSFFYDDKVGGPP